MGLFISSLRACMTTFFSTSKLLSSNLRATWGQTISKLLPDTLWRDIIHHNMDFDWWANLSMLAPNFCLYIFPMYWKHMKLSTSDSSLMYYDAISTECCVFHWCLVVLEFELYQGPCLCPHLWTARQHDVPLVHPKVRWDTQIQFPQSPLSPWCQTGSPSMGLSMSHRAFAVFNVNS